jgi:hypothetical protein
MLVKGNLLLLPRVGELRLQVCYGVLCLLQLLLSLLQLLLLPCNDLLLLVQQRPQAGTVPAATGQQLSQLQPHIRRPALQGQQQAGDSRRVSMTKPTIGC